MNCEIGDLALVVHGDNHGSLVDVISASVCGPEYWVIESLGSPMAAFSLQSGARIFAKRCNIKDSWLRPLRDKPGSDETLQWSPVPERTSATV